jgi:hypothetical protein
MTLAFRAIIIGSTLALASSLGSLAHAAPKLYSDPFVADPPPEDAAYDDDEPVEPQVSWSTTYASRYSFQGFDYSDGHPVLQPEVTGTMGAVSLSLWGNLDQIQGQVTEVDATVRAEWTVNALTLAAGYANIQYPNRVGWSATQELFSEIEAELPLSPSAEVHWDIGAAHGVYGALGLGAERSFGGVTCGLGSRLYAQNRYYGLTGISGLETSIAAGVSWRGIAWQGELARLWTWENGDFRSMQQISGGWLFRLTLSSE